MFEALRSRSGVGRTARRVTPVIITVFAIGGGTALAGTQNWNGNADGGDWFNAGNWSTAVPTGADSANIKLAGAAVVINNPSDSANWGTLNVQAASGTASLTIESDADSGVNGINIGNTAGTSTVIVDGGNLKPHGYTNISSNGTLDLVSGGFAFGGTNYYIQVNAAATLEVDGSGTSITMNNGSNGGTRFAGVNMTDSTSTLKFVLDSTGVSPFTLGNNDAFILNGNLEVDLGGYTGPTGAGSSITLINYNGTTGGNYGNSTVAGPITGTFSTVTLNGFTATLNYNDGNKVTLTDIELATTAVPEPGACVMLGAGGLLVVRRRRR